MSKTKTRLIKLLVSDMLESVKSLQNDSYIAQWSKIRIQELSNLCLPDYLVEIKKRIDP